MSEPAIIVDGISKKYRLGLRERPHRTFREAATGMLAAPLKRLRRGAASGGDEFWALKDVNFEVQPGEVVGVIGRNGAGKSTLLKILSRITEPTRGEIRLRGRVASLLEVGTGFHPELTGRENVYLNGAILGMKREEIRRKFDEIVAFAEVDKFLDTAVKYYSSGMYVRLAFAVAAHLEPEILIVDEVLAVGDAAFQKKCLGKIRSISSGEGRTVLFVSHSMAAVRALCTSCCLLIGGRLERYESVGDCLKQYLALAQMAGEGDVLKRITRCHPSLTIQRINIAGHKGTHTVVAGEDDVVVEVSGVIAKSARMDVELVLRDLNDVPVAFFSPAHSLGTTNEVPAGDFTIRRSFGLPAGLFSGNYQADLYLTHHDVVGWMDCPSAVTLNVLGRSTSTGRAFTATDGKGYIMLDSLVET